MKPNPLFRSVPPVPTWLLATWILVTWLQASGVTFSQGKPAANPGATLFEKQCYGCHNVGGGKKTGPDLMDVTTRRTRDWLRKFIPSAQGVKNSGDKIAVQLFSEFSPIVMPDQTVTPDQIDQILSLISELSAKKQNFTPGGGQKLRKPTPKDIPKGRMLFTGETRLVEGGPPCISCHSVQDVAVLGGGTLGPDLTQVNMRRNDADLTGVLKSPVLPTMSKVFVKAPLKDEEVVQLLAYLQDVKGRTPLPTQNSSRFFVLGAFGSLMLLSLMNFTWRGRLRGVRKLLLRERQP